MRRSASCRSCGGTVVFIAHVATAHSRSGRDYFQCQACSEVLWRDAPEMPPFKLRCGSLLRHAIGASAAEAVP